MSVTVAGKVRDVLGVDEELAVDDEQIQTLISIAEKKLLTDLCVFRFNVIPSGAVDGSNTTFRVNEPVFNSDFDDSTTDDVSGWWIDVDDTVYSADVTVLNARYGVLRIKQTNNSPIPSTAHALYVDYYTSDTVIPSSVLEELGTLLAAHYVQLRLTEPRKISLLDLESNHRLVMISETRFLREYLSLLRNYSSSTILSTTSVVSGGCV